MNTRHQKRPNGVWRRRVCIACSAIFTTIEQADLGSSVVVRKGTTLTPFSRDHLFSTIYDACKHRATGLADATAITATICSQVIRMIESGVIDAAAIAQITVATLERFDAVAATMYRAYHPSAQ